MGRQVTSFLNGQAQYPAQRNGLLHWMSVSICGVICLSLIACQPLPVPAEGDSGSAEGSETTLAAAAPAPDANAADAAQNDAEGQDEATTQDDTEEQGEAGMLELSDVELRLVELAAADLSAELGIAPEQIKATSMQAVDFADSSLGCPEEGMMYAQVITSGYQFMMEVDGTTYEYHGTGQADGRVVRCTK